jgi:hypothetical protein
MDIPIDEYSEQWIFWAMNILRNEYMSLDAERTSSSLAIGQTRPESFFKGNFELFYSEHHRLLDSFKVFFFRKT